MEATSQHVFLTPDASSTHPPFCRQNSALTASLGSCRSCVPEPSIFCIACLERAPLYATCLCQTRAICALLVPQLSMQSVALLFPFCSLNLPSIGSLLLFSILEVLPTVQATMISWLDHSSSLLTGILASNITVSRPFLHLTTRLLSVCDRHLILRLSFYVVTPWFWGWISNSMTQCQGPSWCGFHLSLQSYLLILTLSSCMVSTLDLASLNHFHFTQWGTGLLTCSPVTCYSVYLECSYFPLPPTTQCFGLCFLDGSGPAFLYPCIASD